MFRRHAFVILLLSVLLNSCQSVQGIATTETANPSSDQDVKILSHYIQVEALLPDQHRLVADDQMYLEILAPTLKSISFTLNPSLRVKSVSRRFKGVMDMTGHGFLGPPLSFSTRNAHVDSEDVQIVTVQIEPPVAQGKKLLLQWVYEGTINDPPREPRHLRFVTPSETSGHIGVEGVYLSAETRWYPDIQGSLATFRINVSTQQGWEAVTNGKLLSRKDAGSIVSATWEATEKTEALTLVANRFVKKEREWNGVTVATYLFPEDAQLADEYLEASVQYLEAYSKLLGPYPFPKFAVVENFFASGLGMPSYTLLGAGSIRRHYTQPYALGHEIVHSWIGNYVFNDGDGNWVEGLTTYLSNYYWHELKGDLQKAREERRLMLFNYAVYVPPDQDYPVARFTRKSDSRDNAIGYNKAAMVFHMLRREMGDERFFAALKNLVAEYGHQRAGWHDLEKVFSLAAGRDLRAFFTRWVEQPGGADVSAESDPDFHLFRRIARRDLPPMLNLFVTDPRRLVVLQAGDAETVALYQELAERIIQQDSAVRVRSAVGLTPSDAQGRSVLLLGGPVSGPAFEWAKRGLPEGAELRPDGFRVGGKEYTGKGMALLLSFRHPEDPDHVVSIFYGASPEAVKPVARLLFFYGWNTIVVFDNGKVVVRSDENIFLADWVP